VSDAHYYKGLQELPSCCVLRLLQPFI